MLRHKKLILLSCFALLLLAFSWIALSSGYDLSWWTPEGGGGGGGCYRATAGYALCGAIGQADAGSGSGSGYQVHSGFWVGPRLTHYRVLIPMVVR
jgi:hypothetical protein